MTLGLLWMALANASVLLASFAIWRRVRTGQDFLDASLFLLIRILLASASVLVAGLSARLTPGALGVAWGLLLLLLLARGEHRHLPGLARPDCGLYLGAVLGVTLARLLLQVWIYAPSDTDPLSYHLPKVAEWVRSGVLRHDLGTDIREAFPAGFELLEAWWIVFLHHDVLIEMAGVEYWLLGFFAAAALASAAGLTRPSAWFAGLLFALTPGYQLMATGCMNDGAVAALIVFLSALALARGHPLLLLAVAGFSLGVKPTALYALPGVGLIAWKAPRTPRPEAPRRPWAGGLSLAGVATGLFWYARNALVFGSPVYPLGRYASLGTLSGPGEIPRILFERLRTLVGTGLYDSVDPINTQLIHNSGWGPAVLACGLVALVIAARSDPRMRLLAGGLGASLAGVLALAPPNYYFLRFVLFMPALFAVAAAWAAQTLPAAKAVAHAALVLCFFSGIVPNTLGASGVLELARMPWRERTSVPRYRSLPPEAPVGTFLGVEGEAYAAYGPGLRRPVFYVRDAASRDELLKVLRERGIRWVNLPGSIEGSRLRAVVTECLRRKDFVPLPSKLYEVRGPP